MMLVQDLKMQRAQVQMMHIGDFIDLSLHGKTRKYYYKTPGSLGQ